MGVDYKAEVKGIKENPRKYDAVWEQSHTEHMLPGYGAQYLLSRGRPTLPERDTHLLELSALLGRTP